MRGRASVRGPARGAWLLLPWKNRNTIQARVATNALNRFMLCVKDLVFAPVVKLVFSAGCRTWFCAAGRCPEVGAHDAWLEWWGGAVHGWSDTLSLGLRFRVGDYVCVQGFRLGLGNNRA